MKSNKSNIRFAAFNPITLSILFSMSFVVNAADVVMVNNSIISSNGVPVVNINQANSNGISHNIYEKLNVGKEGLIFNNSQFGANTKLAGFISGNKNLVNGTAKIIVNEVTSKNKSILNGMMEVAGDQAHLIIANPNGLTCESCGFINAEKVTLTTGKPDLKNNELNGYSVNKGIITTNGLYSESPTALLARSVSVNGNITGPEVKIIAGNNYIDSNNQVTGKVTASGTRNIYGIDVAKLGGMYANKISLVSTETGVGVRNLGTVAAGIGGIEIDANGALLNSNAKIQSTDVVSIKTAGALDNLTGKILSDKSIYIDTSKQLINNSRSGNILSDQNVFINSGALNNTNGKIAATNMVAIDTNNKTLTNYGKGKTVGIEAGVVTVNTGLLNNVNGQINGYYVGATSTSLNNTNGIIDASGSVDIRSAGAVNNHSGLIRAATGHVKIDASKSTITNSATKTADNTSSDSLGIIAGEGGIQIVSGIFNNSTGQTASLGDIDVLNSAYVNNFNGRLNSAKIISVKATAMNNGQAGLSGKSGVNVDLGKGVLDNHIGMVSSEEGEVNLKAYAVNNNGGVILGKDIAVDATHLYNNKALMVAQDKITVNATGVVENTLSKSFGPVYGIYFGMPGQEGGMVGNKGVSITANLLNNNSSRIIAEEGPLNIKVTNAMYNDHSELVAGKGQSNISAITLASNYSTIFADGDLNIDTKYLTLAGSGKVIDNTSKGIISSNGSLNLNVANSFVNYGWITGKDKVSVSTNGTLYNHNTIFSDNEAYVSGKLGVYNYKNIVAGRKLTTHSEGIVYNVGTLFTEGFSSIKAKTLAGGGASAILGGRQGLELDVKSKTYTGKIIGM